MDLVSTSFLVVIVLGGGLIALLADWLGRTMGKKRLRFLHLRPRHTAALFTVLAGVLVAIVTIVFVAGASQDVRQWILEGRRAIERSALLATEVKQKESRINELQKSEQSLQSRYSEAAKKVNLLDQDKKELSVQRSELGKSVSNLKGLVSKSQTDLRATSRRLTEQLATLGKTRNTLTGTQSQLQSASQTLRSAATQLEELNKRYIEIDRELVQTERKLKQADADVKSLETAKGVLEGEVKGLRSTVKEYESSLETTRNELSRVRAELGEGKQELEELQQQLAMLRTISDNSRTQPLMFSRGDEVARIVVPANLATSAARNQLTRLLRTARVAAESRGAKGSPAAGFFGREVNGKTISGEEQVAQWVSRIAGVAEERVVVANSLINTFRGEPVALELAVHPNKIAFAKNEVIAETRIDGDLSSADVLHRMSVFISQTIRAKAIERGMIPAKGRDDSLGAIAPESVFEIVQQIRSGVRNARVQAIALEETRAGDPLKIEFRIR